MAEALGSIGWLDLTVENAVAVRDFYRAVVGWEVDEVEMGGYSDFVMKDPISGEAVAGVCHARGPNRDLPAVWLAYLRIPDLAAAVARVSALGGAVVAPPRDLGAMGRFAVVRDPAGSAIALWQAPSAVPGAEAAP
jgi:predicted enzyme related to lactoylglutathione lyase